jgi:transcriptional regulator of acetoin/glycerol metabolism
MPSEAEGTYPLLSERFEALTVELLPSFKEYDEAATAAQGRHRRFQLLIIVGAALTSIFGAVQSALADQRWPGVVVALLAVIATAVANQQRRSQQLGHYLTDRAKAEELRSLYFQYLSGVYELDRKALEARIAEIGYPLTEEKV